MSLARYQRSLVSRSKPDVESLAAKVDFPRQRESKDQAIAVAWKSANIRR